MADSEQSESQDRQSEAVIDTDSAGRAQIEEINLIWSNANSVIAEPESDADKQVKVDKLLKLIDYKKSEKPPAEFGDGAGVVLDNTRISLSPEKQYRKNHEFKEIRKLPDPGNTAEAIVIVKDIKSGTEHAIKRMMISYFRTEEIRCWMDMTDTGNVPSLYLFRIEKEKVAMHMEFLEEAKTLRRIIDEDMIRLGQELVKPFSLYILHGAIIAVRMMHSLGWTHNDLHAANIMVQKITGDKLLVKIIDFGSARYWHDSNGQYHKGFKADYSQVIRKFTGLYLGGMEFENGVDLLQNWQSELEKVADWIHMSNEERDELKSLVKAALSLPDPRYVGDFLDKVKKCLENAIRDVQMTQDVMKNIGDLIFAEDLDHDKIVSQSVYPVLPEPHLQEEQEQFKKVFNDVLTYIQSGNKDRAKKQSKSIPPSSFSRSVTSPGAGPSRAPLQITDDTQRVTQPIEEKIEDSNNGED